MLYCIIVALFQVSLKFQKEGIRKVKEQINPEDMEEEDGALVIDIPDDVGDDHLDYDSDRTEQHDDVKDTSDFLDQLDVTKAKVIVESKARPLSKRLASTAVIVEWKCRPCGKIFPSVKRKKQHMKEKHGRSTQTSVDRPDMEERLLSSAFFQDHPASLSSCTPVMAALFQQVFTVQPSYCQHL